MTALGILDLDYGNTESIRLAFARLGADSALVRDPAEALTAERLVLPGVGAAPYAMQRLRELGFVDPLRARTKPTLGICLDFAQFIQLTGRQSISRCSIPAPTWDCSTVMPKWRVPSPITVRPIMRC